MPRIADRMNVDFSGFGEVMPSPDNPINSYVANPSTLSVSSAGGDMMSINSGNRVPMRGVLPVEQMSDSDLYRFFPYTPYFDRRWTSVYYQLYNGSN